MEGAATGTVVDYTANKTNGAVIPETGLDGH